MNTPITSVGAEVYVQLNPGITTQLPNFTPSVNNVEDVHICGTCKRSFSDINLFVEHKQSCCNESHHSSLPLMGSSVTPQNLAYLTSNISGSDNNLPSTETPYFRVIFEGSSDNFKRTSNYDGGMLRPLLEIPNKKGGSPVINHGSNSSATSEVHTMIIQQQPRREYKIDEEEVVINHGSNSSATSEVHTMIIQQQPRREFKIDEEEVVINHGSNSSETSEVHTMIIQQQPRREFKIDEEDVAALLANHLASEVVNSATPVPNEREDTILNHNNLDSCSFSEHRQDMANKLVKIMRPINYTLENINIISNDTSNKINKDSSKKSNSAQVPYGSSKPRSQWNSSISEGLHGSDEREVNSIEQFDSGAPQGKKRHLCPHSDCSFATRYFKDLVRHMRKHTGERPYQCTSCNRSFSRADKLQMHMRIHSGDRPHQCQHCSYATIDSGSLRKHMRIHNDERPYKCQICSYRSRDSSQLTVHLRTHTGDNPFFCPFDSCPSAFKTSSDLKRHTRMHTGEKPYSCSLCDYKCAIKSNLNVHVKLNHSEVKAIPCSSCDHISNSKRAAKEHDKIHAEVVLKCGICSYSCISTHGMKNHLRIHSLEKPFICRHCNYSCRKLGNLRQHTLAKHPDCKSGRTSRTTKDPVLRTTKAPTHSKPFCVKSYQCTVCDAAFVREDSWRSHMRQHKTQDTVPSPIEENSVSNSAVHENEDDPTPLHTDTSSNSFKSVSNNRDTATDGNMLHGSRPAVLELGEEVFVTSEVDGTSGSRVESGVAVETIQEDGIQSQPVYIYAPVSDMETDSNLRNAEILASLNQSGQVLFAGRCGHFLSIPSSEQGSLMDHLAASLQPGMQYVLSGPIENLVGADSTFIQTSSAEAGELELTASSPLHSLCPMDTPETIIIDDNE